MAAPAFIPEILDVDLLPPTAAAHSIQITFSTQDLDCRHRLENLIYSMGGFGAECSIVPHYNYVQGIDLPGGGTATAHWLSLGGSAYCPGLANGGMLVGERVRIGPVESPGFGGWSFPANEGSYIVAEVTSVNPYTGYFAIDYGCYGSYINPRIENLRGPTFRRMDYPNGFEVEVRKDGGTWKPLFQGTRCYQPNDPKFTVKHIGLLSGDYEYRVRAVSETGDPGTWSAVSSPVTITNPTYSVQYAAVSDLAVTPDPDTNQPLISWSIPEDPDAILPFLVVLERSLDFGETWEVAVARPALTSPYVDVAAQISRTLHYRLRYATHTPSAMNNAPTPPYDYDIYDTNDDGFVDWKDLRRTLYSEGDTAVTLQDPDYISGRGGYPDGPVLGPGVDALFSYVGYNTDMKGRSNWSNIAVLPGRPFSQHIYFPNFADGKVESLQYDGSARQNITGRWLPEGEQPHYTALSRYDGAIYFTSWNDAETRYSLWRVGFDGSYNDAGAELLRVFDVGEQPTFLDVDAVNNRLWWIEHSTNSIYLAALDGSSPTAILSSATNPLSGLCWAATAEKLYFYDSTAGELQRCDFDGSNFEVLETYATLKAVHDICIDETRNFLYCSAPEHGRLFRIAISTWVRSELRSNLTNFYALACSPELNTLFYCHGSLSGQRLSSYKPDTGANTVLKQLTMPSPTTLEVFYNEVYERPAAPFRPGTTHLSSGDVRLAWQLQAPPGEPFTTPPDVRYQVCELFRSDDGWETEVPLGWVLPRFRPSASPNGWFFFFKDVPYLAGAEYAVRVLRLDWEPPENIYYGDWRTRLNIYGWTNATHRLDVNNDGWVNGLDIVELVDWFANRSPPGPPQLWTTGDPYLQVTGGAVYTPDSITIQDLNALRDSVVYPPSLFAKAVVTPRPTTELNPDESTKVTATCPEVSWWGDTDTVYRRDVAYLGRRALPPSSGKYENLSLRFTLDVAQGETITGAYLRFRAQGDSTGTGVKMSIFAELAEDAAEITDYTTAAASAAAPTTASVAWENLDSWFNGVYYDSVDISDVLQEIVDQPGFVLGNHVVLHVINTNPTDNSTRQATVTVPCEAHNNPKLVTFFYSGPTTTVPPTTAPPTTTPEPVYEVLGPEYCDALYLANRVTANPRITTLFPDGERDDRLMSSLFGFVPDLSISRLRIDHASSKLYIATENPRSLVRTDLDGSGTELVTSFSASDVIFDFDVDSDRNAAYVLLQLRLVKVNLTTGVQATFLTFPVYYARSVSVDADTGEVYVAVSGAGRSDLEVYSSAGTLLRSRSIAGLQRVMTVEYATGRAYLVVRQIGSGVVTYLLASVEVSELLDLQIHASAPHGPNLTLPLAYFYPVAVDAQRGVGYFVSLSTTAEAHRRNRIVAKIDFATSTVSYLTPYTPGALPPVPLTQEDRFLLDGADFCFNPAPTTAPPTTVPPTTAPPTTGPPTTEPPTTAPPVIGCGHVWVADHFLGVMRYELPTFLPAVQIHAVESQDVYVVDIDPTLEKVYWGNEGDGKLYASDFHGLFSPVELHNGEEAIWGLAFYDTGAKLFFTEEKTAGTFDFNRIDTDGSNLTAIVTASAVPLLGVAVNNTTGKVAVGVGATTDFDSDGTISLYDAGTDTLDISTAPAAGLTRPVGLCFDETNNHLYVADSLRQRIWRYDVIGDSWTLVRTNLALSESPHGLDWDVNLSRLWWAEPYRRRLRSCDSSGATVYIEQVFDTSDRPFDLRLCDTGMLITTAPPTTPPPTTGPPTTSPPTTAPPTTVPPTTEPPIPLTAQYLAWTDVGAGEINACNEDGSVIQNVLTDQAFFLSNTSGLTYSTANNRYYWINWRWAMIASCLPDGSDVQMHNLNDTTRGIGLYAHAATEQLFVVDNQRRTVSVMPLEGVNTPQILLSDLRSPLDVVVGGDRLYVSDGAFILSCDLDGGNAQIEAEFSYTPYGLAWNDDTDELFYVVPGPLGAIRKFHPATNFDIKLADAVNAVKVVLDVDAGKMFWSEPVNNRIRQAALTGDSVTDIYAETGAIPNWLAIYPNADVAPEPSAPTTAPPTTAPPTTAPPTTAPPTTEPPATTAPPTTVPPTTRPPTLITRRGREQIVVDQAPYAGSYYPFIRPSDDLEYLLGDLFLLLPQTADYTHPLSLTLLENFDEGSSEEYRLQIRDADDTLVLDTNDLTKTGQSNWGSTKTVVEWSDEEQQKLLRIVVFIARDSRDAEIVFPSSIEPTDGRLDARAIEYVEPAVREIEVRPPTGPSVVIDSARNVVLAGGYNMALNVAALSVRDGALYQREIEFDATPGSGLGKVPGCDEEVLLQSINGVTPGPDGNLRIELEHAEAECYRLERTIDDEGDSSAGNSFEFSGVSVVPASLTFTNNCEPCCKCEDFVNVYRAIRRLYNLYKRLGQRAEAVRDQLAINNARFEAQRECRKKTLARTVLSQLPGCRVGVAGALCNNQDIPIRGFTLRFDFSDSTLSGDTSCVRCDSVFRRGNVDETRSIPPARFVAYKIRGSWPVYEADFDCISSADNGYVTFQLEFPDGADGDQIALKLSILGNNPGEAQIVQERVSLKCSYSYDETCCETNDTTTTAAPTTSGNILTLSRHASSGLLLLSSSSAMSVVSGDVLKLMGTVVSSYNMSISVISQLSPTLVVLNKLWAGDSANGTWMKL